MEFVNNAVLPTLAAQNVRLVAISCNVLLASKVIKLQFITML